MEKVGVAMLSFWHVHAPGYAEQIRSAPDAEIRVVWDEDEERGKQWAERLGVPFEPDLERAVGRDDVDGVVVDAPTNMHTEVILAAAGAGKHIFTEKVVALTVAEVDAIAEAVEKAGVHFVVSFPFRGDPRFKYAREVVDKGLLGRITTVRVRHGHGGVLDRWLPDHFLDPEPTGGGRHDRPWVPPHVSVPLVRRNAPACDGSVRKCRAGRARRRQLRGADRI